MLKDYYRLGRPINALAGCIAVLLSGYVAGPYSWWPVIMAAVTVLLITVSTNAWNDYIDIEIDRINQPERPLPSGRITPTGALIFSFTGSAVSLLTAAFINQPAFLIALASNALLYLYSWKLKCTVLVGNAAVATIIALCFIFGGVAAGNIQPTLALSIIVFFAMMGREILKTMADYKGDLQQNCQTIATAWGMGRAQLFVKLFLAITAAIMLAAYFTEQYSASYLYIVTFAVLPILFYVAINTRTTASVKTYAKNSLIMKYCFFVWFLAVALGAGFAP